MTKDEGNVAVRQRAANERRVVVTGVGAVTTIGIGKTKLWEGVRREKSAIRRITRFDPSPFKSQLAGEVDDFDPQDYIEDHKKLRRLDRYSTFGMAAAMMAVQDAKLDLTSADCPYGLEEIGIYMGSALGGVVFSEEQHEIYLKEGPRAVNPMLALSVFIGAVSTNIAMDLGINGPNIANANSCASGAIAIGEAFRLIKSGGARAMLAGGCEVPLSPLAYGAFSLIRAMSVSNETPELACRPFDRDRDGFIMAEGSAVLVLEELETALQRGAPIYAEVLGYGTSNDAFHMAAPLPSGEQAARCVRLALTEAALLPADIDYINAHASSTPLNDKTETLAIKKVFGDLAYQIPISGTKGMHGHSLGSTGAIEAVICQLIMQNDWLPPTVNLQHPDPECDLDCIQGHGREQRVGHILSNSFGFGGINAALIFGRYDK